MNEQPTPPASASRRSSRFGRVPIALGVVVLAVAATVLAMVLISGKETSVKTGVPKAVSEGQLRTFANSVGHPVYWAGPVPGFKLELTKTANGNVFVRYLPSAVPIGDMKPAYTTIGTYPREQAYGAVLKAARGAGQVRKNVTGGGVAVYNKKRQGSVYLAYPGSNYLIEIFAVAPQEARQLALSGRIAPVK